MPPFYPDHYQNQYHNQYARAHPYPHGTEYSNQYNQYQYAPPQNHQGLPYPQIQVNIPPRQYPQQHQHQQPHSPQSQSQQVYHPALQPNYAVSPAHPPYQYQSQPQYPPQYQPPPPPPQPPPVQAQQYYHQPAPQYTPQMRQQLPPPPRVQVPPPQRALKDVQPQAARQQQQQPPASKPPQPSPLPPPPTKLEPQSESVEPDYDVLLLSLADEYLEAAHKMSIRSDDYYKLTATALGCIETVLNTSKLPPLREAQVSLRYAQLLYNETENNDDAERILTKTVDLCERLKYHDLRYAAQLLLIRILHKSRPKAALKDLQAMIQDIQAYKHVAWEYAFRLQYVMFSTVSNQTNDLHAAIAQLEHVSHLARQSGDHAILALAAVMEASIHLQTSGPESVQLSQRALAKARALQLVPDVTDNPQICIMIEMVDLCGQIKGSDIAQSEQKRKVMQQVLYPALAQSSWRPDGLMYLAVGRESLRGLQTQESGLIADRNGKFYLAFSWLPKSEVEDLGYLLSGISAANKSAGDGGKAEKFLEEGLEMIREIKDEKKTASNAGDIMSRRQRLVECHFLLEIAFLQCSKGQWKKAQATIKQIETSAHTLGDSFPREMKSMLDYAKGSVMQGTGDLDAALRIFQSPSLNAISKPEGEVNVKTSSQSHKREEVIRNFSILATMNMVFIFQQPNHPQHHLLTNLLNKIDPLASHNSNKNIQAAWNFLLASLPNNTILKTKQYLGNALNAAQSITNAQVTTLCLVTMQEKFFKGVVGEQALKCARAASHQAKRLNEPMWIAVASGLEADCLNVHGMTEDSLRKKEEMERAMAVLPERVRNSATGT